MYCENTSPTAYTLCTQWSFTTVHCYEYSLTLAAAALYYVSLSPQFGKGRDLLSSHDSRATSTKPHSRERLASSVSQPSTDQLMAEEDGLAGVDELQSSKELDSYREKITLVYALTHCYRRWFNFDATSMITYPETDPECFICCL